MDAKVSVILPCRDEEKTIARCIGQVKKVFKENSINGEIIVSDSSSDKSYALAKKEGDVILVKHDDIGYGIAIMRGIEKASGSILVIGVADGTYDFSEIPKLIEEINHKDLVIGSRFKGKIRKGSMSLLHRYLGNPALSFLLNIFFKTRLTDTHSGFRAIRRESYERLNLQTTGMEFASEMIIKAAKVGLKISEVPVTYSPRLGRSKLKSFSDGWRHLRFMLLFSPTHLFIIPGSIFFIAGLLFIMIKPITGSFLTILGYQVITLGIYARIYATHSGYETHDDFLNLISNSLNLEKSLFLGFLIIMAGILFISVDMPLMTFTTLVIGFQTLFSAFFISMMVVEKKQK